MRRPRIHLYIILSTLALALVMTALSGSVSEPEPVPTATPAPTPEPLFLAEQSGHPALMAPEADGLFHPTDTVTRKAAFDILGSLLDVPAEDGTAALTKAGLLQMDPAAGEGKLARNELSSLLSVLAAKLTGDDAARTAALAEDVAQGVLTADGQPSQPVTRGELAQVLAALTGRTTDGDALFFRGMLPPDVERGSWAWEAIGDMVTEGVPAPAAPGFYRLDGWLYAADGDGKPVMDSTIGLWTFGPGGAYTTGSEALDGYLKDALAESGANELSGSEALEAVYLWVKEHFEYKVTPNDLIPEEPGSTGWEYERGLHGFENGGGTCYAYAAAFGLLARCLGEEAHIVAATINQYKGDHSFVVIPEDGVDWIYDVELEDARPERHGELELFRIENYVIYNYWYTPAW